jgi:O-antigen/teichoic acid export membrane protein
MSRLTALAPGLVRRRSPDAAARPDSIWRHLWSDVILLGIGSVAVVAAQLAFRSILIAVLVPSSYGRLSLVLSVYNTIWVLGTSGLPNSVARYLAIGGPADDAGVIRSALRANAWLTLAATAIIAAVAGLLLGSVLAAALAAVGLASLVYSLLAMGILRGRGHIASSASIMPVAALAQILPLAVIWLAGLTITPMVGFAVFSLGNVAGLAMGIYFVRRTTPRPEPDMTPSDVPSPLRLLAFSMWLALATAGLSALPLVLRAVAVWDSYTVVAVVDVALVLFVIPQRLGTVIVLAAIPRASKAVQRGNADLTISLRAHFIAIVPFVLAAATIAFTPLIGWIFEAIGRPEYEQSARYLAFALLAGPARILYGLVEGALVAHGEGRFLALTSVSVTACASGAIVAAAALGSLSAAFGVFVVAFWLVYLIGLEKVRRLTPSKGGDLITQPGSTAPAVGGPWSEQPDTGR